MSQRIFVLGFAPSLDEEGNASAVPGGFSWSMNPFGSTIPDWGEGHDYRIVTVFVPDAVWGEVLFEELFSIENPNRLTMAETFGADRDQVQASWNARMVRVTEWLDGRRGLWDPPMPDYLLSSLKDE